MLSRIFSDDETLGSEIKTLLNDENVQHLKTDTKI